MRFIVHLHFIIWTIYALIKSVKEKEDTVWDVDLACNCLSTGDNANCSRGDLSAVLIRLFGFGMAFCMCELNSWTHREPCLEYSCFADYIQASYSFGI